MDRFSVAWEYEPYRRDDRLLSLLDRIGIPSINAPSRGE